MKQKILMTLALLMTAASGAWADIAQGDVFMFGSYIDFGTSVWCKTYSGGTSNDAVEKSTKLPLTYGGYENGKHKLVFNSVNGSSFLYIVDTNSSKPWGIKVTGGEGTDGSPFTFSTVYDWPNNCPQELIIGADGACSFAMPASDATVDYEIVRDLAVETTANITVGEGQEAETLEADSRLRIQRTDNGYEFVDALSISFSDDIEEVSIDKDGFETAKLVPQFYIQQDDAQNPWTLVPDDNLDDETGLPNNLQPGQVYCLTFVPAEGSAYDGETPQSVTITLFEGYPVEVPAGEMITYYKDENLKLEENSGAQLYTITAVADGKATATELTISPANTAILVKNLSDTETKTFLLIPTEETADNVTAYAGFTGTLTATTIPASTATQTNYAFNGKQFVYVKNSIDVAANKAWLEVGTPNSARALTIVFDDSNATGLKAIDNGQLIMDNDDWYDLNGRKLSAAPKRKGVYIKNGQKVVVK